MSSLIRWNPTRDMLDLRREFDRLFANALDLPQFGSEISTWGLALDVVEHDDAYVVKASIPGVAPDDVDITLADNVLTIRGEFKEDKDVKEEQYRMRERRTGSFTRSVTLPTAVNRDNIEATYDNGVLTLNVPKAEEVKPKRIAIKLGKNGKKKVIEG